MNQYEIYVNSIGEEIIKMTKDDNTLLIIPTDPSNSDYQAYLRWLENPNAQPSISLA